MVYTSSSYCKCLVNESNVGSLRKLSELYTTEFVDSHFHLCGRGYHHDRVNVNALAAGTADVDEDLVALYLGYYD
jgi:hypothetical protein